MCKRNVNLLKNLVMRIKIVMVLTFVLMANVKESAAEIGIVMKDLCKIFFKSYRVSQQLLAIPIPKLQNSNS